VETKQKKENSKSAWFLQFLFKTPPIKYKENKKPAQLGSVLNDGDIKIFIASKLRKWQILKNYFQKCHKLFFK
jgi:hypothetical protein